jgi:hypothetical protein
MWLEPLPNNNLFVVARATSSNNNTNINNVARATS